ncbi:MAG: carboxypeptidase regulatory-like domain-containing protein [Planctomyces sp.]|nr:carboxypeptidase regulatory-like domain-containing protein [Planctomyces sp.]
MPATSQYRSLAAAALAFIAAGPTSAADPVNAAIPSSSGHNLDIHAPQASAATRRRSSFRGADTLAEAATATATDIVLGDDRRLRGRFVDVRGQPIDGALVRLATGAQILRTTTNADGEFTFDEVPSGVHQLTCGSAGGWVRCWTPSSAPPNALSGGLTFQDGLVRGQAGLLAPAMSSTVLMSTAAASGAIVGGATLASDGGSRTRSGSVPAPEAPESEPPAFVGTDTQNRNALHDAYGRLPPMLGSGNPLDPRVEFREINGQKVRYLLPASEVRDPFGSHFGDPRDQPGQLSPPPSGTEFRGLIFPTAALPPELRPASP